MSWNGNDRHDRCGLTSIKLSLFHLPAKKLSPITGDSRLRRYGRLDASGSPKVASSQVLRGA